MAGNRNTRGRGNGPGRTTNTTGRRGASSRPAASSTPRKRPNLWPRRIITGTGLLVVLALLGWGVWSLASALIGGGADEAEESTGQSPARIDVQSGAQSGAASSTDAAAHYDLEDGERLTADGIYNESTGQIRLPDCLPALITASATAENGTVGSAQSITVRMLNTGETACLVSRDGVDVAVYTGDQLVYDSARCTDSQTSSGEKLLLGSGAEWTGALTWDGKVHSDGCAEPDTGLTNAQAGTYRAQLFVDSAPTGSETIFQINEPVAENAD